MTKAEFMKLPLEKRVTRAERKYFERIIDALKFYADPETYFAVSLMPDPPCGDIVRDYSKIDPHPMGGYRLGKRARKALNIRYVDETPTSTSDSPAEKS